MSLRLATEDYIDEEDGRHYPEFDSFSMDMRGVDAEYDSFAITFYGDDEDGYRMELHSGLAPDETPDETTKATYLQLEREQLEDLRDALDAFLSYIDTRE